MGCTFEQTGLCNTDENPAHEVTITGFVISKFEVTQALWKQVMGGNPSRFKGDSLPVENVSWDDVQMFLKRLNMLTGKNYRLPTEAEWEYAARGGIHSRQSTYSGGLNLGDHAWFVENASNTTHAAGQKQPNELGLYDMSGNVWEWCSDSYGPYSSMAQSNPQGAKTNPSKVLRGGCYASNAQQCRVSSRKSYYSAGKDYMTGFRLAMDDDREAKAAAQAERERLKAEEEARNAEQQRIEAEQKAAEAAKAAEQRRVDSLNKAEAERIAAEKAALQAEKQAYKDSIEAVRIQKQQEKSDAKKERLASIPFSTFFTLNAEYLTMPQWGYGFKIGTMRVVGWYFSVMTNFHYKGSFSRFVVFTPYTLTGKSSGSIMEAQVGLTLRCFKPISFHLGAGFVYRTFCIESTEGWFYYPRSTFLGPEINMGLMYHIGNFVLSTEFFGMYNLDGYNRTEFALGGKIGVGFCLPTGKGKNVESKKR